MDLKVYHENDWKNYPAKVLAEHTFEWEGEPYSSPSVMIDPLGNIAERTVQRAATITVPETYGTIEAPIPVGAVRAYWRFQVRATGVSANDPNNAGWHMTFLGLDGMGGQVSTFPNDGEWHNVVRYYDVNPGSDSVSFSWYVSQYTSPEYEVRHFQLIFDEGYDWPEYWDGSTQPRGEWMDFKERYPNGVKHVVRSSTPPTSDTPSDRAHDLWYNDDDVPHEWIDGYGWYPIR